MLNLKFIIRNNMKKLKAILTVLIGYTCMARIFPIWHPIARISFRTNSSLPTLKIIFNHILSGYFVFICSCYSPEDYPVIVQQLQKQNQFNSAILNMYKLYAASNCECYGYIYGDNQILVDSAQILTCKVSLDTLLIQNDTSIYYFNFYNEKFCRNIKPGFKYHEQNGCVNFNGLLYIGESAVPIAALIPESAVSVYGLDLNLHVLDSCFESCLKKDQKNINILARKLYQNSLK